MKHVNAFMPLLTKLLAPLLPQLFSGANDTAPLLGFFNVSAVTGWSTGQGTITFPIANMRTAYTFQYRSGLAQVPLVTTKPVTFAQPNEPTQIRLALGSDDTTMTVMWVRHQMVLN